MLLGCTRLDPFANIEVRASLGGDCDFGGRLLLLQLLIRLLEVVNNLLLLLELSQDPLMLILC